MVSSVVVSIVRLMSVIRRMRYAVILIPCLGLVSAQVVMPFAEAQAPSEEAFLPTWKLLKASEKMQFIAGYLYGWRDAAKVTGIAIDFIKENPKDAVDGLVKIQSLYSMEGLKADIVTKEIDTFFGKTENKDATLSQAITAVRAHYR